jgi:hypothetical protein
VIEVPLRLNLTFEAGEATLAFASRLAARNGIRLARLFCQDVGIRFLGLMDGSLDALARLAEVAGASMADLGAGNVVRRREGYFLGDNRLPASFFRRHAFHVCPACLQDDIAGSTLAPDAAAYGRLIWQVVPSRTCRIHGMALVDLGSGHPSSPQDFTAVIRPSLRRLDGLAMGASLRPPSELERYVAARLEGNPVTVPFLDDVELHAARFCEVLGACVTFGRGLRMERLGEDEWHFAGATGMTIAAAGKDGVRHALCELRRTNPYGFRVTAAPQPPLRQFRSWLSNASKDRAYRGFRAFVEGFLADGGDADIEFKRGRAAAEGSYESRSVPTDTSHEDGKYRFLANGRIHAGAMTTPMSDGKKPPTETPVANVEAGLTLGTAVDHLRCDLALFGSMMARGIIRRSNPDEPNQPPMFARKDLDQLLARIETVATPVLRRDEDEDGIPWVAASVGIAEGEIVQLILEGVLGRVAQLVDRPGVRALLVRSVDVRAQLEARAYPGLPWIEAAAYLGVTPAALTLLIEPGNLEVERATAALSGYQVAMISQKSLDAFRNTFAKRRDFYMDHDARDWYGHLRPELYKVQPAISSKDPRCEFFRRSDAPKFVRKSAM